MLTSTPQRQEITTQAEVHEESMHNTTRPFLENGTAEMSAATRRGGGEVTPGGKGQGSRGQQSYQGGQDEAGGRRRGEDVVTFKINYSFSKFHINNKFRNKFIEINEETHQESLLEDI